MFSEKLILRLKNAYTVTVLTGAGVSAESGVPTFRGKDGLWKNNPVEKLATIDALESDPKLFWEFYHWRRSLLKEIKPNLGHFSLVDMENYFEDFTLITQNVDNLHTKAGSSKPIELHGNIKRNRCTNCSDLTLSDSEQIDESVVPKCTKCGSVLKPDVILFGEALDQKVLSKGQEASATCEVFISIGTSSLVEPAASLPYIAKGNGAYLVEINTEKTPLSDSADEVINYPSAKVLTNLVIILDRLR
ncbi:MAG: NAD-dependent deacylase [Calditrichaeota bacterium]|nr:MAG: NAD-dependent deacylase [Calditrichota bacterium]MBL1204182.1 NAD-dependent deacylase [Calditrichota bacterium]NOG44012.1 NAD-dependent deacylase [Calditrichota bacterium]